MPEPIVAPRPIAMSARALSTCFRRPLPAGTASIGRTAMSWRSSDCGSEGNPPLLLISMASDIRCSFHARPDPRGVGRAPVSHTWPRRGTRRPAATPCASISRPGDCPGAGNFRCRSAPLMSATLKITPPPQGAKIAIQDGKLRVPENPIIPFIEGDGTGPDIWRASVRLMDAAVAKAYGGKRRIHWMEVFAGEKSNRLYNTWLPEETVAACREYLVSIKGPLTTPVGGGIRSLNVALRQMLDLYVCLRPVRWFKGVPSPVRHPEKVDMVIFRENTEDIYTGIEFES